MREVGCFLRALFEGQKGERCREKIQFGRFGNKWKKMTENKTPKFKPIVKYIHFSTEGSEDDVEGTSEYEVLVENGQVKRSSLRKKHSFTHPWACKLG